MKSTFLTGASALALICMSTAQPALADDSSNKVEGVVVTAQRSSVKTTSVPAVVETVTAAKIRDSVNIMTSAEAIKYLPSIEVRERYIGDRNGIVSTRTTGTVSSAESLVYADDLLLSNLLGNSYNYPPRWGLVAPDEIERIEVIYGPFSALYPGNSMGGVITMTTRMPEKPEMHVSLTGALENFKLYGVNEHNGSGDANIMVGDRIGPFAFALTYDHLDAQGHPMSFSTANLSTHAAAGSAAHVTGAYGDIDQNGAARLLFGAYSIDHSVQDQGKVKLSYDLTPSVRAVYTVGLWGDQSNTGVQSFLTNTATGQPFYNGSVNIAGKAYTVSGLNPGNTEELHLLNAVSIGSDTKGVFDWRASASVYDFLTEHGRSASNFGQNTTGTDQIQDGTGWATADLQGVWRPIADVGGKHEISFGYHIDNYRLSQDTYNTTAWLTGPFGALASASHGQTQTQAIYLQDVWKFAPRWTLTLGGRDEFWAASNGSNYNATTTPKLATYATETRSDFSPKAALAFDLTSQLETRFSFGRALRYPTVSELYQQVTSGTTLVQNDPNLKPEDVLSYDWSTQYSVRGDSVRLSLFEEDRRNALFSQTDTTVSPNLTQIENISAVRIRGVETAFETNSLGVKGLNLSGSVTYADSAILSDVQAPTAVGRQFPRIPRWRARLTAVYHQNNGLTYSLGYRYSSGAFSTLLNTDVNHDTYGGISAYSVWDAKVSYKFGHGLTAAIGVDNLGDQKYYVSPHPYPQTTGFLNLKYDY